MSKLTDSKNCIRCCHGSSVVCDDTAVVALVRLYDTNYSQSEVVSCQYPAAACGQNGSSILLPQVGKEESPSPNTERDVRPRDDIVLASGVSDNGGRIHWCGTKVTRNVR